MAIDRLKIQKLFVVSTTHSARRKKFESPHVHLLSAVSEHHNYVVDAKIQDVKSLN